LHLPALSEQAVQRDALISSMGLETMLIGIKAALRAIKEEGKKWETQE
jgi:pyrrolidone-carboxylate peptidase